MLYPRGEELKLTPMPDDADPPRKYYGFKPREFERANDVAPAAEPATPMPPTADPGPIAQNGAIDVRALAREASTNAPLLSANAPANRDNEVHAMLRENFAQATAAGLNDLAPKPRRPSRRKRDYWLLLGAGNSVLAAMAILAGPGIPVVFVSAIAGIGLFSSALTWVMWQIMDDY